MNHVIIGVGSNIDPQNHIRQATDLLGRSFEMVASSQFRETKPIGMPNQANFLNGAVLIKTSLEPPQLKKRLQDIEDRLGRTRNNRCGPRTIDLDIIVWNGEIVDPEVKKRAFLQTAIRELQPWNSI